MDLSTFLQYTNKLKFNTQTALGMLLNGEGKYEDKLTKMQAGTAHGSGKSARVLAQALEFKKQQEQQQQQMQMLMAQQKEKGK